MKRIIRRFFSYLLALWLLQTVVYGGSLYANQAQLLIGTMMLTLTITLALPLLELLMAPLNLITFGLIAFVPRLVCIVLSLWVADISLPRLVIGSLSLGSYTLPSFEIGPLMMTILVAVVLSRTEQLLISIFSET